MKNRLFVGLLVGLLMFPSGAFAQVQSVEYTSLVQQVIALLTEQVRLLTIQLEELKAQNAREEKRVVERDSRRQQINTMENNTPATGEVAESKARIDVEVNQKMAKVGVDTIEFRVKTFNDKGNPEKLPVTVETDCPDMPSRFTVNGEDYPPGWFIVTKDSQGVVTGSPTPYPSTTGEFTFTFTMGDVSEVVTINVVD